MHRICTQFDPASLTYYPLPTDDLVPNEASGGDNEHSDEPAANEIAAHSGMRPGSRSTGSQPSLRLESDSAYVVAAMQQMKKDVPTSFNDAVQRKDAQRGKKATEFEFQTLTDMNIWELVQLPKGRIVVKIKWV